MLSPTSPARSWSLSAGRRHAMGMSCRGSTSCSRSTASIGLSLASEEFEAGAQYQQAHGNRAAEDRVAAPRWGRLQRLAAGGNVGSHAPPEAVLRPEGSDDDLEARSRVRALLAGVVVHGDLRDGAPLRTSRG